MKTVVFSTSHSFDSTVEFARQDGAMDQIEIVGILDDDPGKHGKLFCGYPVVGSFRDVTSMAQRGEVSHFWIALGAMKHKLIIAALHHYCLSIGLNPLSSISTRACVMPSAHLKPGHCVSPMAYISSNCKIDALFSLNVGAVVYENCSIHENVTISGNAFVGGLCTIEKNVYIGPGAIIGSEVRIGANSIIAAGSVVLKDVAANSLVKGNPAKSRPMRPEVFYLAPPAWMLSAYTGKAMI
jgi:sugar O-acyltransferase (sialic acid O-acetyltransferase NeuD family)